MTSANPTSCTGIYTIGHSNHDIARFIALLKQHQVHVLVDVRSQPHSRYSPQFNDSVLKTALENAGLKYLFLGKQLGGRPDNPEFYDADGYADYAAMARQNTFKEGIARLETGRHKCRLALMCSEEDPAECHRFLLVTRVLEERGVSVTHIRGDGQIQTTEQVRQQSQGAPDPQLLLFGHPKEEPWKSTRSVLPRNPPSPSSQP